MVQSGVEDQEVLEASISTTIVWKVDEFYRQIWDSTHRALKKFKLKTIVQIR